ncbi:MAG TPA: Six-hairpin glycosidase-like protein [Rhodanobacteraceae bacterium]
MQRAAGGAWLLKGPFGQRAIPAQSRRAHTASPLFDGLYAMAQADLASDSVDAIRDPSYDHGHPIPCRCFVTGVKWPYVWTRDLGYSTDLALAGIDPERARNGLLFKLSGVRVNDVPKGLYVMQDTGSGGSWPISTDRVVWFLGARHLLGDRAFAGKVWKALGDTLAQDRKYAFDAGMGLYRGETSFLDWRQQTYPAWTANNVVFIAQSFALSTNVLHYDALRLAARMAARRHDPRAATWAEQAVALKRAINRHFWRPGQGLYMSYIGGNGQPVNAYDLLGIALAVTSGVADPARARAALGHYPVWPAGSPVIWPERSDQPIYQNRAIWPFVSAYALRAARRIRDPALIAFEIRSIMRGPALAGSNMENYTLLAQSTHVDDGELSGPVVDSTRQLWSVAAYLDMVREGVFGITDDGRVDPELPVSLVPMLFGTRTRISLQLPTGTVTLQRPAQLDGNLMVAGDVTRHGRDRLVTLRAISVNAPALRLHAPLYAPVAPGIPEVARVGSTWEVRTARRGYLYVNGSRVGAAGSAWRVPVVAGQQCFSVTRTGDGLESLPSPLRCEGRRASVSGPWPRAWRAPATAHYRIALRYRNDHGPISSGITAAVKRIAIDCAGSPAQVVPVVMPQSDGEQASTTATFAATAGAHCTFALKQGFNMSFLAHNATFTGGEGGATGPLNAADIGALQIARLPSDESTGSSAKTPQR